MDRQDCPYVRLQNELAQETDLQEFSKRLNNSPILDNPYYLGLLLMTVASSVSPKAPFIRSLILAGANPNFAEPEHNCNGRTTLMAACLRGNVANVDTLLKCSQLDFQATDTQGQTALLYAFRNSSCEESIKICKALLSKHPSLACISNKQGLSPLAIACCQGKLKIAELLLREGIDPNTKMEPTGATVLQMVIGTSGDLSSTLQKQAIIVLLAHGADPYLQDELGEDSFDYAQKYLFDLQELEEVKANTEPTELTKNCPSETQSLYMLPEAQVTNRLLRDFGDFKSNQKQEEQEEEYQKIIQHKKGEAQKEWQQEILQNQILSSASSQHEQQQQQQISYDQKFQTLSQQIWQLNLQCQKDYQEAWEDISKVYQKLCQIAHDLDLKIQIVGSFATGLWTPYSDIDIVFINQKNAFVDIRKLLGIVYDFLAPELDVLGIGAMQLNENFKVPFIKLQLQVNGSYRVIQLCIFQRKSAGRKYVKYIRQCLQENELVRPTFFAFHRILEAWDLHRPYRKGMKTYTIFLMICLGLQAYPAGTLAQALYNVIYYYAMEFPFEETVEQRQNQNGVVCSCCRLNMMDPLNPTNNVGGRDTNVVRLIQMLHAVQCGFSFLPNQDILGYILDLSLLL